jgi:hypothetical protein
MAPHLAHGAPHLKRPKNGREAFDGCLAGAADAGGFLAKKLKKISVSNFFLPLLCK